jgi:hypothetical protein
MRRQARRSLSARRSVGSSELLLPVAEAIQPLPKVHTVMCADSGYHSEANLQQLEQQAIEAFILHNLYRQRDPRYAGQERHAAKPDAMWDKFEWARAGSDGEEADIATISGWCRSKSEG